MELGLELSVLVLAQRTLTQIGFTLQELNYEGKGTKPKTETLGA